jgi:hypothetical protein
VDLHAVDFANRSQAEVYAQIILREIAAARPNLFCLRYTARRDLDSRAYGEAVTLGTREFEADPVIPGRAAITKNQGCTVYILDYYVHLTIVEQVTYRETS